MARSQQFDQRGFARFIGNPGQPVAFLRGAEGSIRCDRPRIRGLIERQRGTDFRFRLLADVAVRLTLPCSIGPSRNKNHTVAV